MKFNWKAAGLATLCVAVTLAAGCSGINASQSVSPASFFMPGLLKVEPQPPADSFPTTLPEPQPALVRAE
jgi:hypothetical protein